MGGGCKWVNPVRIYELALALRDRVYCRPSYLGARELLRLRETREHRRAIAWFERFGITAERIMTDNGSAYKSFAYRDMLNELGVRHKRTRPCMPRTNGKAERFAE